MFETIDPFVKHYILKDPMVDYKPPASPKKSTPRKPHAGPSPKKGDLGRVVASNESATVREKVKKWQGSGGGVLVETETAVSSTESKQENETEDKRTENQSSKSSAASRISEWAETAAKLAAASTPAATSAPSTAPTSRKSMPLLLEQKNDEPAIAVPVVIERRPKEFTTPPIEADIIERRPKQTINKLDREVIDATAPKKRIVSDGHWVRKKPPPPPPPPPPKPKPRPPPPTNQYAWVRPPLLPRPSNEPEPEPPSPTKLTKSMKPPKEIKVYSGQGREKSLQERLSRVIHPPNAARAKSSGDYQDITSESDSEVTNEVPRIRRPKSAPQTARKASSGSSDIEATSPTFESKYSKGRRKGRSQSRSKRLSAGEQSRTSRERSASPELAGKPQARRRRYQRRSADAAESEDASQEGRSRRIPIVAKVMPQRSSSPLDGQRPIRRRSKSVGNAMLDSARTRHHSDAETDYIRPRQKKASYREEFTKFKPESNDLDREITGTVRRKPVRSFTENQAARATSESIPSAAAPVYGSRVEAWLSNTSDPFLDGKKSKRSFSFESRRGDSMNASTVTTTDSQITNGLDARTPSARKSRSNLRRESRNLDSGTSRSGNRKNPDPPAEDDYIEVEYSSTTSVPSLRRNGARRGSGTPTKDKERAQSPDVTESDIASSAVSSSVHGSDFHPPDAPARHSATAFPNRRLFLHGGKKLSTIASVETFHTRAQQAPPSETSEASDGTAMPKDKAEDGRNGVFHSDETTGSVVSTVRSHTSLRRKLTKHSDLISVLSMPQSKSRSIVSARSIRTHRSRLATATIADLMQELASDETKYMRELKTLADGVIVVLLKCVLSKSDAALAAGLYSRVPSAQDVANATKLIRELGMALSRLKTLHNRIPKEDPDAFLNWSQTAHKIYADYVKTWRLGFEDVVVNLATDADSTSSVTASQAGKSDVLGSGLPRNEDGYVVDADGERVDVAFLLKRPLVRLKYLTKTVKGINIIKPSEKAGVLTQQYEGLMDAARNRVNEEKARIEDEAAAAIDTSRARDPRSLGPLSGVRIDSSCCVRARDYFDMHLKHSSGQVLDCRIELLIRDDPSNTNSGGDVLICEINSASRWLLFPPVMRGNMSARLGDHPDDVVVMIRGMQSAGQQWQELMTLYADDEDIAAEWVQMLGMIPRPPRITHEQSFRADPARPASSLGSSLLSTSDRTVSTAPLKSRTPSPREIEVPLGEQAGAKAKRWSAALTPDRLASATRKADSHPLTPPSDEKPAKQQSHSLSANSTPLVATQTRHGIHRKAVSVDRRVSDTLSQAKDLNEAMLLAGGTGSPAPERSKPARYRTPKKAAVIDRPADFSRREVERTPTPSTDSRVSYNSFQPSGNIGSQRFNVWIPESNAGSGSDSDDDMHKGSTISLAHRHKLETKPSRHQRAASAPANNLSSYPKLRASAGAPHPSIHSKHDIDNRGYSTGSGEVGISGRSKPSRLSGIRQEEEEAPPPPPPHRSPSATLKKSPTPVFTPNSQLKRRSSSPLKHEYQPSTASEYSLTSEDSGSGSDQGSYTSESSDDDLDDDDMLSSLAPSAPPHRLVPAAPKSIVSAPEATLKPSDSASQGPYRQVPEQMENAAYTFGSIFTWSDRGNWEPLHSEDCSLVISPGLISAYKLTSLGAEDIMTSEQPLIAVELTPLVPIRRGTALDISIRSPPTPASLLKSGSNIMFRSRTPEECEMLYSLINTARINNPTYIALQNARPPAGDSAWGLNGNGTGNGTFGDRRSKSSGSSWWQLGGMKRSKSYRASTQAPSTAGNTDSSVGTMFSVMHAMKRFSGTSRLFSGSAANSKPTSQDGGSAGSHSSGLQSPGGPDGARSPPVFVDPAKLSANLPNSLGITNAKVRLYVRQTKGKWLDLGSARLSVLQKRVHTEFETVSDTGVNSPMALQTGVEKRIVVSSKGGDCLLDATLGESCFERVARTGIAVSVWEDVLGEGARGVAATGGVAERRVKVYMLQLKNERECAFTFSLLGKFRY